jgi:hypothetical protein
MKIYSIEKVGNEYVVKVDDQSVMKMGSRRRAAQLVLDASGLLDEVPLAPRQMVATSDGVLTEDTKSATDDAGSATENDPASGGVMPSSITRDSPEDA